MEEIEQAGRQAGQGRAHINLKVLYESKKRIEKAPHLKKKRIQSKRSKRKRSLGFGSLNGGARLQSQVVVIVVVVNVVVAWVGVKRIA